MYIKTRDACRVCGSNELIPILSLGEQFVTNFVDKSTENEARGPLDLVLCEPKRGCGLLQLRHTLDHDILYRRYWYKSGISKTMVDCLADIVSAAKKLVQLSSKDIVLDIGSNDGTLLRQYKIPGLVTVGFEPSNLHELGREGNSMIINDYFNYMAFKKEFNGKKAKVITSIAMFYDLEDPNAFVEDIKKCLDRDGVWIIQMNYLGLMLENNTFDNISHEHLEYYSLMSLEYLLNLHNMEAFDVELNDVNGGSFRIYVKHKEGKLRLPQSSEDRLQNVRDYEKKMKFCEKETYDSFAERIEGTKNKLMNFLRLEAAQGKTIFIYGASTRGLVMLQYFGIDNHLIKAATDKNPDKWGKYIVGTGIPIISIEDYRKRRPDYLLVLPYHFIAEIANQEKQFLVQGGRMIVATPEFKIITKDTI